MRRKKKIMVIVIVFVVLMTIIIGILTLDDEFRDPIDQNAYVGDFGSDYIEAIFPRNNSEVIYEEIELYIRINNEILITSVTYQIESTTSISPPQTMIEQTTNSFTDDLYLSSYKTQNLIIYFQINTSNFTQTVELHVSYEPIMEIEISENNINYDDTDVEVGDDITCYSFLNNDPVKEYIRLNVNLPESYHDATNYEIIRGMEYIRPSSWTQTSSTWELPSYQETDILYFDISAPYLSEYPNQISYMDGGLSGTSIYEGIFTIRSEHDFSNVSFSQKISYNIDTEHNWSLFLKYGKDWIELNKEIYNFNTEYQMTQFGYQMEFLIPEMEQDSEYIFKVVGVELEVEEKNRAGWAYGIAFAWIGFLLGLIITHVGTPQSIKDRIGKRKVYFIIGGIAIALYFASAIIFNILLNR